MCGLTIEERQESYGLPKCVIGAFFGTVQVIRSFLNETETYDCVY